MFRIREEQLSEFLSHFYIFDRMALLVSHLSINGHTELFQYILQMDFYSRFSSCVSLK